MSECLKCDKPKYKTSWYCKSHLAEYATNYQRKKNTGWTLEEYNAQKLLQNDRCAICGIHEDNLKRSLSADHNHKTKQKRGLLCTNCNIGIGNFKENPDLMLAALEYLKHFR